MKLKFFKQDALDYFKANVKSNIEHYSDPDNKWIYEQFEDPFEEIEVNCAPFELYIDPDNTTKMDCENIKILYPALKELTESQACDERLWSGLCHSDFYKYTQVRWSNQRQTENMKKESVIKGRYFYSPNARSNTRHTLAKLWWIGKMLYDDQNPDNPLHFVDTLARKDMLTRISDVFTSRFSRNIHLLRPFFNVVDLYDCNCGLMSGDYFRSLVQYLNILGGLYLVDYLDEKEIEDKLLKRLDYYDCFGPDVIKDIKDKRVNTNNQLRVFSKKENEIIKLEMNDDNIKFFLGKKINDEVSYNDDILTILKIF